ncbi:hypothetical protein C8R46DRAFT_1238583 [Mycena filopes]|nr:hypothetical protein C8R46DRAFT_1238583 [Mycena filopes]
MSKPPLMFEPPSLATAGYPGDSAFVSIKAASTTHLLFYVLCVASLGVSAAPRPHVEQAVAPMKRIQVDEAQRGPEDRKRILVDDAQRGSQDVNAKRAVVKKWVCRDELGTECTK